MQPGYHAIITKSPIILDILEVIKRVAVKDSSVLLLGESGVGKEIFAREVHLQSRRSSFQFVSINCAAIPEGLLESELFGHVKGAFTNAISDRQGRFELADGGTIFLDEIGDLPLTLQAKILRVIQEKQFEKVGSDVSIIADTRIVAATNKDLEQQIQKSLFREDLYYRLNVLPIFIPPLRQRPEDIPLLANFFLDGFMQQTEKQFDGFTAEALEVMISYSWPGNVRELRNSIERACVIGVSSLIGINDLFIKDRFKNKLSDTLEKDEQVYNLKEAVNDFKTGFIRKALEKYNWNKTETAKALAIQRTYLSRLIKELGIDLS